MPLNPSNPDEKPRTKISGGLRRTFRPSGLMQIALLLPASVFIGWLAASGWTILLGQRWIAVAGIVFGGVRAGLRGADGHGRIERFRQQRQSENHSGKNPKNDPEDGDQGGER